MRHLARRLGRSLSFSIIAVLTLAIGIGANTAIFSVIHGVLLKPLPFPDSDRLVGVWQKAPGLNLQRMNASPATYYTYREENRTFENIALWRRDSASITGVPEPEQVRAISVTDGFLPILGVRPALGRWFTKQDDSPGAQQTVILTHGYWERRFGRNPSVVGQRLLVDSRARDIIGVMPPDFKFLETSADIIVPLQLNRGTVFIGSFGYMSVARLKPGATVEQANADVGRMIPLMATKFAPPPGFSMKMLEDARIGPDVKPLKNDVIGDIGKVLWVLMGTVGIVLLIACANVANLLLVHADGRQQEFAIRAALGADWKRIAGELLAESLTLAVLGGVTGLAFSYGALRLLVKMAPSTLPRLSEIAIDGSVIAFTFVVAILAGLFFGIVPVIRYAAPRVASTLRSGGRTMSDGRDRHRTRGALVVVQVALALVLLISSGLMIRTLSALRSVQPGFTDPDKVLTLRVSIPAAQVPEPERVARMYNDIVDRVAALPGVTSAALTNSVTMDGMQNNDPIFARDRVYSEAQLPPLRRYKHISPGTFQALGNSLLAGRDVSWTDVHEKRPVVIVSENLARELWGSAQAALGKQVREGPKGKWREVVGVAGNEYDNGVHQKAPAIAYWPFMVQDFWGQPVAVRRGLAIAVRSNRAGSVGFLQDVQRAVWSVNPNLPLANVRTLREIADESMARSSFALVMLSIAAGVALLLGIIGIYGVISYTISQRTREIGIRMALGASQQSVRVMFVRHGLLLTGIGVVCGFAAAVPLTRFMTALLYGTSPLDPITYFSVAALMLVAAVLAAYVPARGATAVEPLHALRFE